MNDRTVTHVQHLRRALLTATTSLDVTFTKRAALKHNTSKDLVQQREAEAACARLNYEMVQTIFFDSLIASSPYCISFSNLWTRCFSHTSTFDY